MKKIKFLILAFLFSFSLQTKAQADSCFWPSCFNWKNTDLQQIFVAIKKQAANTVTITASDTISIATTDTVKVSITNATDTIPVNVISLTEGNVGGFTSVVSQAVLTSTSAYAANDNIGGIQTINNAFRSNSGTSTAIIQSLSIWDPDGQAAPLVVDFWMSSPTNGTYTNDATQDITGDQGVWLGSVSISTGDYLELGTVFRATITGIGIPAVGASGSSIYATIYTTGTPTYSGSLQLITTYLQD